MDKFTIGKRVNYMQRYHNNTDKMKRKYQDSVNHQTNSEDLESNSFFIVCKQNGLKCVSKEVNGNFGTISKIGLFLYL